MNTRELVVEYIKATEENDARNRKIEEGLNLLCEGSVDSAIDSMTYRLYKFYDDLMIQTLGEETFEWVIWYLYDSKGTNRTVGINGVQYSIETPEQLYDICIDKEDRQMSVDF